MSFLALVTAVSGLACSSSTMNFTLRAAEVALDLVEVHLEAVDHVLADLSEDAGGRRHIADAKLLGGVRRRRHAEADHAAQQQRAELVVAR